MAKYNGKKFLRLRYAMCQKGYTQADMCEAYNAKHERNIYPCEFNAWMQAKRPFRLDIIWFIMRELDLPLDEMFIYFPDGGVDL